MHVAAFFEHEMLVPDAVLGMYADYADTRQPFTADVSCIRSACMTAEPCTALLLILPGLFATCRIGYSMIDSAEKEGKITPGKVGSDSAIGLCF
jgi:hypothetical protein